MAAGNSFSPSSLPGRTASRKQHRHNQQKNGTGNFMQPTCGDSNSEGIGAPNKEPPELIRDKANHPPKRTT